METVTDFYFWGLQNHCMWWLHHEIKRRLLLRRKVMTNLESILKSRDITLQTKAHLIKAMVFPEVMYGCESWTIKKSEKEEWNWRNQPTWLQALIQSHSYQDSMVLAQRQKYRSMEQNRKPRDKSMHIWIPYLWQRRQEYTMD